MPSVCVLEIVVHPAIADIVVSLIAVIAVIESFFKTSFIDFRLYRCDGAAQSSSCPSCTPGLRVLRDFVYFRTSCTSGFRDFVYFGARIATYAIMFSSKLWISDQLRFQGTSYLTSCPRSKFNSLPILAPR